MENEPIILLNNIYEAPLSISIKKEYNLLALSIVDIKPDLRTKKIIDGTGGRVSISDLIAYQIGWGNLLISWYQAGLKQKIPQIPGEGFSKWNYIGLAQHFYKKYQYDSYVRQEQEFYNTVKKIIAIVETEYKTKNLDKEGVWSWCTLSSGKRWPLSKWVVVNTVAPYKRASSLIKRYFHNNILIK